MSPRSLSPYNQALLAVATCALFSLPALADSQARIVRLSDVQGSVQIDKNSGLGFESAFLNLPITQGTQLRTRDNGRAEIEFEDGSTLRVAPNSTIEFSTLGLSEAGERLSTIELVAGMIYVNWLGKQSDSFTLNFSREKLSLDHAAHFRIDVSDVSAKLAVFKGDVNVEGAGGKIAVAKNKTATFDVNDDDKLTLASHVVVAPLDSWDKESISYHEQYAKNTSQSPYQYGLSDLNYYGAYSNVPGYGMMWQPYFAGVGWDPFTDGAWGWYPGMGYLFASAYPWGWLPYRYGNWMFIQGSGWMWQPGGWNGWLAVPHYTSTTLVHVSPLVAPSTGTVKTVVVGKSFTSSIATPERISVNAGSAGLGIPRGFIENLHHLNGQVSKNGSAEIYSAPRTSFGQPGWYGGGESARNSVGTSPSGHTTTVSHSSASSVGAAHK
jgi:hypothetical protein